MSTPGSTRRSTRRLSPGARRAELVEVAARAFAARAYDDVSMEAVAHEAGVSRALLYRYFPGKPQLFAAVYQQAADRLLDQSELDADGPVIEQVVRGLEAHLDYFEANAHTVLAANRTLAGDPVVAVIISDELDELRRRLLDAAGLEGGLRAVVSTVVLAWLVQVRVLSVEWLEGRHLSRATVREICVASLLAALGAVPGLDPAGFSGPDVGGSAG